MSTDTDTGTKPPVKISPEARHALLARTRQWTGWNDARLVLGDPRETGVPSPYAATSHTDREVVVNADALVLNPNRVLLTVTPFRLRQEAVLTGVMLHEAGHARYSLWQPRTAEQRAALCLSDRSPVSAQCLALARLMEEPRVEALMARDGASAGAAGLEWTMRAAGTVLAPTTNLSIEPGQQIMDVITSWALRAAKQFALQSMTSHTASSWAHQFNALLTEALTDYLRGIGATAADTLARKVVTLLLSMADWTGYRTHTDAHMMDCAQEVLDILYPGGNGDSEDAAMPGEGIHAEQDEQDEQDSDPSQDSAGEDDSDEQGGDEGSDQGEGDDASDEGSDENSDGASPSTDADSGSDDDVSGNQEGRADGQGQDGQESEQESALAQALAAMEADADESAEAEASTEASKAPPSEKVGTGAGAGEGASGDSTRAPRPAERIQAKAAETFLRNMINPSESVKTMLTEAPSATVDAAAMAAWKAGGQQRDPMFFRRLKRTSAPTPPVKIAVLVDVSSSMDELQEPSGVLAWALASAAYDLRNFAGRGTQVESCLIYWGNEARVIQANGTPLSVIHENECAEGTRAMHSALGLVAEQIPGFFDVTEEPVNRLLVQFTDWELFGGAKTVAPWVESALEAGVNMLTIAPKSYSAQYSSLAEILRTCKVQRGYSKLVVHNPMFGDGQVWDEAAKMLSER